jgi:succinate dehydrogenase hydrophobic anchor subunit
VAPVAGVTVTRITWTWLLQRITGLVLVAFLFTHISVNHLFLGERIIDFSLVNERLAGSTGWRAFYILFVPSCVFHAMNGLWGILADHRPADTLRGLALAVLWLVGLALTYIGADTLIHLF